MKALVTGGGGFVGSHLVKALRQRGDSVRSFARGDYPELRALGAETVRGDLTDAAAVAKACEGMDVVFHTAALAGGWGDPKVFEAINVHGTEHVIAGCRAAKVPALVHTSSPSAVHVNRDVEGADESIPLATHFTSHYARTKADADRIVCAASDAALRTVALRPHIIWGPGDHHLLPRIVVRSRAGRLRQIGTRDPKTDTIYIDNCVHAHLLAADKLLGGAAIGGKAYFVSDDQPIGAWTMAARMLEAAGAPRFGPPVPVWLAMGAAACLEAAHFVFRIEKEPVLTRYAVSQLSNAQWFDISAAKRDLGYAPIVTLDEGFARLKAWCAEHPIP